MTTNGNGPIGSLNDLLRHLQANRARVEAEVAQIRQSDVDDTWGSQERAEVARLAERERELSELVSTTRDERDALRTKLATAETREADLVVMLQECQLTEQSHRMEASRWKSMVREYQERDGVIAPGAEPFFAIPPPKARVDDSRAPLRAIASPLAAFLAELPLGSTVTIHAPGK